MTDPSGTWEIVTATPIGKQSLTLELTAKGSALSGTARNDAEFVNVKNGGVVGDTVTFAVDLKKPFPLTVVYTLKFEDDTVAGSAKAGFFPASAVVGKREQSRS